MLRALLERDIVPDVVIGTSAGALNGAAVAYAPNLTGVAQLAAVWEQLRTDHVFPGGRSTGRGTSCAAAPTSSTTTASKR